MTAVVESEQMLAASTFKTGGNNQAIDFVDEEQVGDFSVRESIFESNPFED